MPKLIITGPVSAILKLPSGGDLYLGTGGPDIHGTPAAVLVQRNCVEELSALATMLRTRNHTDKLRLCTPDPKATAMLLSAEEVCCAVVNGKPMQLSLETYCELVHMAADKPTVVVQEPGVRVEAVPCNWMRAGDARMAMIFCWNAKAYYAPTIEKAFEEDEEALAEVQKLDEQRRQEIDEHREKIKQAAEAGDQEELQKLRGSSPMPVIGNYLWSPYAAVLPENITYDMRLAQLRLPFDVVRGNQLAQLGGRVLLTDANVGKEFEL